jgi:hypothetical protein
MYKRGAGWKEATEHDPPAEFYLVEGLFLDSILASAQIAFDIVVVLEASWDLIAELRRTRDAAIRVAGAEYFRSPSETEEEIERTRRAYLGYPRERQLSQRVVLEVNRHFRVERIA